MKTKSTLLELMLFVVAFIMFPINSYSQDGSLDLNFGINGKLITTLGGANSIAYSVAMQSDDKIVVAGYNDNGTKTNFAVARYNKNGELDPAFGAGGIVTTAIGTIDDEGSQVVIQPDGKILVTGISWYDNKTKVHFSLVRYTSNGILDSSFGINGIVTTTFESGDSYSYSIALQDDNKIIVSGYCNTGPEDADFALVRYNSDGTLDNSFGSEGKVLISFGSGFDACHSIAIFSDGKILASGYSYNGNDYDFACAKLNTNGTLDLSFGNEGKVTTAIGSGNDFCYSVAIQSDGKIVLAGSCFIGTGFNFALARYDSKGNLDTNFNMNGMNITSIGRSDIIFSVALQKDGKIVAAGNTYVNNGFDFALLRFKSDGTLDPSFGTDGKISTDFGNYADYCYSIAIQNDNKIVAAGFSGTSFNNNFALARYDNTFTALQSIASINSLYDVFPNPTSGISTIRASKKLVGCKFEISNALGKTCIIGKLISETTSLNLNSLPSGVYFIHVEGSSQNKLKIINK
jgi:uncharacterized delta-60 repeat protein